MNAKEHPLTVLKYYDRNLHLEVCKQRRKGVKPETVARRIKAKHPAMPENIVKLILEAAKQAY